MSQLSDLENGIVSLIAGIQAGGESLFAVARGTSHTDRAALEAELRGERMPAALVALDGRRPVAGDEARTEAPRFALIVAQESLRGANEARLGGTGVAGGFDLLEQLTLALQDATILAKYRLIFVDEIPLSPDGRVVMYRQRYEARRLLELNAPTFDGQVLGGSDSLIHVILGSPRRRMVTFGFPGIDGVFRYDLGGRGRLIVWRGQLRADDDSALNAIEQTIEGYVADPRAFDVVDAWGRTHRDCVLGGFERRGPRRKDSVSGKALQDFELTFEQLSP